MEDIQAYHVDWFVTREIHSDVTIRIRNGQLLSIEQGCSKDAVELCRVALVSGLVNAHTHLEFSDLTKPIPTMGRFTDWIRAVVAHRRANPGQIGRAIEFGLRESIAAGTTALGEIATVQWSSTDYSKVAMRGVVFQEILGLTLERVALQKEVARSHAIGTTPPFVNGISPHAPYSTHLELVHEAVALARQTGCPLAMHVAETSAELEFLESRTGEFREMLTEFGIWNDDPTRFGCTAMDYLQILAESPRSLIIHGNYLTEVELQFLASNPNMTLVYCPRTHAAFGHSEHPWRHARELGIRIALGTDSRASNPDLSLFAELQFLAKTYPDISHLELLELGSTNGRQALGIEDSTVADFTLIRANELPLSNPTSELFSPFNTVAGTMIRGDWVWQDAQLQEVFGDK